MPTPKMPTRRLFDLDILAATFEQAVALLGEAALRRDGRAQVVVTPNVDHVVRLERAPDFKRRYAQADFLFADGMPLVWASRLLGAPLPERVTGADLFTALCRQAQAHGWRVGLLGGMPGQQALLAERFAQHYPGLDIAIRCPSMQFDAHGPEGQQAAQWARELDADILFVCLGMPKQENWSLHHAASLRGGILLCVGAAMEFAVGLQKRAPRRVQAAGLEWLWRLLGNPRRLWRRYLVDDPRFLLLCWRQWRAGRRRAKGGE
ncbi:WecB/TagA/CpsF family glycosyltransferase [Orrella sp. JC864]|uniref:WecB/TagA/CpsF family glycosyltransferase n=1 Tax=Orrella sp. JC864 TaxID=3120298 RepID=UPI00300875B6